jgi:sortase A
MRRILGAALTGAGLAILVAVGIVYAKGRIARDQARTQWEVLEAHGAVAAVARQVDRVEDRTAPARGAPVARIMIPAIGVDEVVVEGVDQDQLAAGPGHLPGSAFPGDSGNAVISAHRDRQFHGLDQVAIGDTVITETLAGRVAWVVVGRRVVEQGEPALFSTATPTLTLTTCWPVRFVGPAPDRLLITAKPVRRSSLRVGA